MDMSAVPKLSYDEPDWSSVPLPGFSLEIIKEGVALTRFPLVNKRFFVVGRLPVCDIELEHPSISRYHCILQFSATGELSLYDCSVHGTTLNKTSVPQKQHTTVHIGDIIRFGASTRIFVLHGPIPDMSTNISAEGVEISVDDQDHIKQLAEESIDQGVSWGFGEDAIQESTSLTTSDQYHIDENAAYFKDPRKTLTQWLLDRGQELTFEYEEHGPGNDKLYIASIQLSLASEGLDTLTVTGSAGRKREAERLACLEACAKLASIGVFSSKSRAQVHKEKMAALLGDDDDDDNDSFYDRTLPQKSKHSLQKGTGRGQIHTAPQVDTYETLIIRKDKVVNEIEFLKSTLEEMKQQRQEEVTGNHTAETDDVDDYLARLQQQQKTQTSKLSQSNLQQSLYAKQRELTRLDQLITLTKPSDSVLKLMGQPINRSMEKESLNPSLKTNSHSALKTQTVTKRSVEELSEHEETDDDDHPNVLPPQQKRRVLTPNFDGKSNNVSLNVNKTSDTVPQVSSGLRKIAPVLSQDTVEDEWLPPSNQSGDGKTRLNAKLGY